VDDAHTTIAELKSLMSQFVAERDWGKFHDPKSVAMAVGVEAAELMEPFRWLSASESADLLNDAQRRSAVAEELADVVLLCLEFSAVSNIDIASAVRMKLDVNNKRYPIDKSRGKSTKYTEL
jgi:NTP pyrophosphatase (non-canonical NTP hydrolase)